MSDLPAATSVVQVVILLLLVFIIVAKFVIYGRIIAAVGEVKDWAKIARGHGQASDAAQAKVVEAAATITTKADEIAHAVAGPSSGVNILPVVPVPVSPQPWDGTERRKGDSDDGTTTRVGHLPDPGEHHP